MSEPHEIMLKGNEYVHVRGLRDPSLDGYYKLVTEWSDGRLLISPLPKTRAELAAAIAAFGGEPLSDEELNAEFGSQPSSEEPAPGPPA
ncbi:MAG: hypothetical protein V9E83_09300 [Baekduia sp.]